MKNMEEIKAILKGFVTEVRSGAWLKSPVFWLRFAAYAIPLSFLLYVLYWNFLPFGYNKTFTIDVGAEGDTSGEFYLEPSRDLSERKTAEDGTTYRELNGIAYAVFKPKAVLKDAEITVEVEGDGVSIIPPVIDFDPNSVQWDYSWDFTQGKKPEELGLLGEAFPFDGCMYFDGKSKLELASSSDMFEDGPFTLYAEWTPADNLKDSREIVGHYNWELLQNTDSVSFQVGRMNNENEGFYSVRTSIKSTDFFQKTHSVLAIYSPSSVEGYISLYLDREYVGRTNFGTSTIFTEYNGERNLSFGRSGHRSAANITGCISQVAILNEIKVQSTNKVSFNLKENSLLRVPVLTSTSTELKSFILNVEQ